MLAQRSNRSGPAAVAEGPEPFGMRSARQAVVFGEIYPPTTRDGRPDRAPDRFNLFFCRNIYNRSRDVYSFIREYK